jgi:hypothetical protein
MAVRQISDSEKQIVIRNQKDSDGILRCFISGEIINEDTDEIEFDHLIAFSYDGPSDIVNVRAVLKDYNRRKRDQTLYDVRDQIFIQRLYEKKQNDVKLQDILEYKGHVNKNVKISLTNTSISISDSQENRGFDLLHDDIINVDYFYCRIPVKWIKNDDQEGLQPRVIDQKRLFELSKHLKQHPQLAPAIARILNNQIYLFDGQHKTAAQILNGKTEIDCKVFISPQSEDLSRKLFDQLMVTNLDAHSKLRQVPFYNSTLIERFSVIYKEIWEDFTQAELPQNHSEEKFSQYLIQKTAFSRAQTNEIIRSMIIDSNLSSSSLNNYIAKATKDNNYPLSIEVTKSYILPNCLFLLPSSALFDSVADFRNQEISNFQTLSKIIEDKAIIDKWIPTKRNITLTTEQIKARRIWHKGAVMTWGPMLRDILINSCNIKTEDERQKLLYRQSLAPDQIDRINTYLERLFNHSLWVDSNPEIDKLLLSASRQEDLFKKYSLTIDYILTGTP